MTTKINYNENLNSLKNNDKELYDLINQEKIRQNTTINLIASENYTYPEILEADGSILTNKYAEGYPGARYYGGCEIVDQVEKLAVKRACELFKCKYANVQAHSGSSANFAAYNALCKPGDTIMGMTLDNGGHLTHGAPVSFSGKYYNSVSYALDPQTEMLDYDKILSQAKQIRPQVIVAGYSTYPRIIDFKKFRDIADEVGAYLMVDTAHIAGLIAAGAHPSPIPYAHLVTSTTHKTLRGPRAGLILTNDEEIAKKIDKSIFPGCQGGPFMHIIAAKAACFKKANSDEFRLYIQNVIKNTSAMAKGINDGGLRLVTGGTDNHLSLIDCGPAKVTGKDLEAACAKAKITINKNAIPYDKLSPTICSGIRVGGASISARGFNEEESYKIGQNIAELAFNIDDLSLIEKIKNESMAMLDKHPLY